MSERRRPAHEDPQPQLSAIVRIRPYQPRDYEQVWALHREGVLETTPQYLDLDPKYEDDLRNIEIRYLTPGSNLWVAGINELVGMIGIQRVDGRTGRVRRTRVTLACRHLGIAQRLLATAERFCREQGYTRMILDTTESQTAAHRLYESAGFLRTGERFLGTIRVFDYEKILK